MQIAICDDLVSDIEIMKAHIDRYAAEHALTIRVEACSQEAEIVAALEHADAYDLLFVDIYMDTLSGIELARRIRKNGIQSRIVFFSTSREHGVDAFEANAIQYLIKPVDYERFENAMKIALADKLRREKEVAVFTDNEIVTVALDRFLYSEAQRNYQYIHVSDGSAIRTRMSCTRLYEMLEDRRQFVKMGASFIINLDHVARISSSNVWLKDGQKLPVPRGSFAPLKQRYVDFYMKGGAHHV